MSATGVHSMGRLPTSMSDNPDLGRYAVDISAAPRAPQRFLSGARKRAMKKSVRQRRQDALVR